VAAAWLRDVALAELVARRADLDQFPTGESIIAPVRRRLATNWTCR
jgi:hypothetical protein